MTIRLRPLGQGDARRVFQWRNSEPVARWMYRDGPIPANEHGRWIYAVLTEAEQAEPIRLYWIVELQDAPVGVANLVKIDRANGKAEWAYYLGEDSARGRGLGAQIEYAVLSHVFGPMGLNKLWCEVLAGNDPVVALHESFGFRREALLRDHVRKAGAFHDVVGLGLLAADWAAAEPACRARLEAKGVKVDALILP